MLPVFMLAMAVAWLKKPPQTILILIAIYVSGGCSVTKEATSNNFELKCYLC
jgi:drug/metabolite transporter (DMT)-like permease